MFKTVDGGEYLSGYFYIIFLYSPGGFMNRNVSTDQFTEQMGMFVNVVHSILKSMLFQQKL